MLPVSLMTVTCRIRGEMTRRVATIYLHPKPVKKKKKFIRKKEATTYRLIPGFVDDDDDDVGGPGIKETEEEVESRKEEQRKYGIFYDDAYNYMKHLRSLNEQATLVSTDTFRVDADDEVRSNKSGPSKFLEFFSTDVTEEEEIDPDVLAALEDAPVVKIDDGECDGDEVVVGDVDDFLDDDFISKAGGAIPVTHDDLDEGDSDGDFISDEEEDENDEDDEVDDDESDLGSDFSDYDERPSPFQLPQGRGNMQDDIAEAQTALILKNFEEGYGFRCSNQLSDEEEEMPTAADYENLKHILSQDKLKEKPVTWSEVFDDKSEKVKVDTSKYLYEDEDEYEWKEAPPSKPKFDCVSILSLNSNTRNRPTDLIPPRPEGKKKRQKSEGESEPSSTQGLSLQQLEAEMRESRRADKACTFRPKDETVDEKKARKKAIKDERKERRQEKKANREVFAIEREKMKKEAAALSKSVKSVKIC